MGVKIHKTGRIVILLAGRFAGKKAIVVRAFEPTQKRPYPHLLVAGIERGPRTVTKAMGKSKILRRSRVKAFTKFVNVTHVMPTRYLVGFDLKKVVTAEKVDKISLRKVVRGQLKAIFTRAHINRKTDAKSKANASQVSYFFQKLRF